MNRFRPILAALPVLAFCALAGCAAESTDSTAAADKSENVGQVAQAYEIGETDVYYHLTWYPDDADPPNTPDDPFVWTRSYVTSQAGLVDWQYEYTTGNRQMIVTPDAQGALAVVQYLATVPVPPIGSRIEITIGDPGRRW